MMWRRSSILLLILVAFIGGCGPGAEPPGNKDVIATAPNQAFPFSSASTYTLPDKVAEIAGPVDPATGATPAPATLDPGTESLILTKINENMAARGYTRLTNPSGPKPDIFVQASVMRTSSTEVYYDYWYGYWGGYYDPWYGGTYGYGWAPTAVPYVVTSTLGTLIIEFTNPNNPDPANKKIPSVWVGVVTGLVDTASRAEINSRVQTGIDQAFEQSPYIRR